MKTIVIALLSIFSISLLAEEVNFDQRILTDPKFKPLYEKCEKIVEANNKKNPKPSGDSIENSTDLATCAKLQFDKLPENTRNQLADKYYRVSKNKKVVRYKKITPKTYEKKMVKSSAYNKLLNYLKKRLAEALYGKDPKTQKGVDHGIFFELYKNQLSNNIVLTLSSFCLEAEQQGDAFIIPSTEGRRKQVRVANMKNLGNFDAKDKSNLEQKRWMNCIATVDLLCKNKKRVDCDYEDDDLQLQCKTDVKYTHDRACLVTHALKKEKEVLSATIDIQKKLKDKQKNSIKSGLWNVDTNPEKSVEELATVTSGELEKNYTSELEKEKKLLEECKQKGTPDQECQKILKAYVQDKKDLEKMSVEQQLLADEKIKELEIDSNADKDAIEKAKRNIIAERDISDEKTRKKADQELEKLGKQKIEDIEAEITASYKNEADAIKAQIQAALKTAGKNKKQQMADVSTKLGNTATAKKQLMHYNNMVAGFLELAPKDKKKKAMKNTVSIQRELKDSAFTTKRGLASDAATNSAQDQGYQLNSIIDKIKQNTDLKDSKKSRDQGSVMIGVDKVNKILNLNGSRTPSSTADSTKPNQTKPNQENRK